MRLVPVLPKISIRKNKTETNKNHNKQASVYKKVADQ